MNTEFSHNKILIIGGDGFIGKNLSTKLRAFSSKVFTVSNAPLDLPGHYCVSILDYISLRNTLNQIQPDIVIHLAASKNRSNNHEAFVETINSNILGTLNVIQSCIQLEKIKHLVLVGTSEEYGANTAPFHESQLEQPISAYSFSKTCTKTLIETLDRIHNIPYTYLRPTVAYGPGQGTEMFIPSLITTLLQNNEFCMTDGKQLRDFIFIDDLSDCITQILLSPEATLKKVFNIGSGSSIQLAEIAKLIAKKLKKDHLLKIGAKPHRDLDIFNYSISIDAIIHSTKWHPHTSLEEGISQTISYYDSKK